MGFFLEGNQQGVVMKKSFFAGLLMVATVGVATPSLAADPELCLDCHEPAEDWEGMSSAELLADAMDLSNKRHKDNAGISAEEMKQVIATLMPSAQ
jgi:hypothetical protein